MSLTQSFRTPLTRRRLLIGGLTLGTTACAAWAFGRGLTADGGGWLALALLSLFVILFFWISLSFWLATVGFLRRLSDQPRACAAPASQGECLDPSVRVAILIPVYNEEPQGVLARLRAIHESLQETGQSQSFDFFILSDTTNSDLWLAEELGWARLIQEIAGGSRVCYRHRPRNAGRKAGNIADFCERWGSAYRYMIVLDADSVMSGATLVEMVRRMELDPDIGILQVPPMPVNRVSLFARCQQFAAQVYGPVFLEGFAWWSHIDSNYFGHNAIIRVAPFTQHCGLSALPGPPPLGGEILSHDFVEAALMRRAGLKVCLAHDLDGSYEESPPTLLDYAVRDQRWCQGNLQHLRLVLSPDMRLMSRLHMSMGVMAYLSSPLWLLFLVLSFLWVAFRSDAPGEERQAVVLGTTGWPLFAATMTLLLLPKLWGYLLLAHDRPRLSACGGAFRVGLGVLVETLISILVAPILMAFHVTFVISTFLGRRVGWHTQRRDEAGQQLLAAAAAHWKQMLVALAAALIVWMLAPEMLPWLAPVLCGLLLAIPLSVVLSSVWLGQALARHGVLIIPAETAPPPVLQRLRHFLSRPAARELSDSGALFRRVIADPAFTALHQSILLATGAQRKADPRQLRRAEKQLRAGALHRLSDEDRKAVLSDPSALASLHLSVWTNL